MSDRPGNDGAADRIADFVDQYDSDDEREFPLQGVDAEERIETPESKIAIDVDALEAKRSAVDPEIARRFTNAVILANAGLLFVSLGVMVVYFRGMIEIGGVLVLAGLFALARTYQQYRAFEAYRSARDEHEPSERGADRED